MTTGIYGIFDASNGECLYVGQSRRMKMRWRAHLKTLSNGTHGRKDFVKWFNAHGKSKESLRFVTLETLSENAGMLSLNQSELFWFMELAPKFWGRYPSDNTRNGSQRLKEHTFEKISDEYLRELYLEEKLSLPEMEEILKIPAGTIYWKLRELSVPMRSIREAAILKHDKRGRKTFQQKICIICNSEFEVKTTRASENVRTCSRQCRGKMNISNQFKKESNMHSSEARIKVTTSMRDNKNALGNRGGKITSHNRWHVARNRFSENCELCLTE